MNTLANTPSTTAQAANHISTVRQHLLDQLQALRTAAPKELAKEITRSQAIAQVAQVVVNTAKVEVDYLKATRQKSTPFLEPASDAVQIRTTSPALALAAANSVGGAAGADTLVKTRWIDVKSA